MKKKYIKPEIKIIKIDTDNNLLQSSCNQWKEYKGSWISRNGFNYNDNGYSQWGNGLIDGDGINIYSNDGVKWFYYDDKCH